MLTSTFALTILFLGGAFLVAAPAYVFGGRADHAAIALLVYAMAAIGLVEILPGAPGAAALSGPNQIEARAGIPVADVVAAIPATQ